MDKKTFKNYKILLFSLTDKQTDKLIRDQMLIDKMNKEYLLKTAEKFTFLYFYIYVA